MVSQLLRELANQKVEEQMAGSEGPDGIFFLFFCIDQNIEVSAESPHPESRHLLRTKVNQHFG